MSAIMRGMTELKPKLDHWPDLGDPGYEGFIASWRELGQQLFGWSKESIRVLREAVSSVEQSDRLSVQRDRHWHLAYLLVRLAVQSLARRALAYLNPSRRVAPVSNRPNT